MSDCSHDPMLVQALVDGELDAVRAADIEAQVAGCPSCAAEHARLTGLSAALRDPGVRARAPERLHGRLAESLAALQRQTAAASAPPPLSPAPPRPKRWAWLGAGAGLAIAASVALLFGLAQIDGDPALTDELVASHVRSLQVAHLTDVATSDQHVVKPWFDGKLDYSPPVIELKPLGFALVGGRLDYVGARPVAAIVYQRGRHTINLFVWPGGSDEIEHARNIQGYGLRHWRSAGMSFWAVSDVNPADLALFEADLKARTGP